MRKLVLPLMTVLALAAAALLAACADSSDEASTSAPPSDTPAITPAEETPTAEPTEDTPVATEARGGGGGEGDLTPVPITTPFPTPLPVPADWATYARPDGLFTVRYPSMWFREGGIIQSWDPSITRDKPGYPPDSVKVDLITYEAIGSTDCGAQTVDPRTGEGTARPGAAPATLGGVNGWQLVNLFDPSTSGGLTRIHAISVIYKGICFVVSAQFAQEDPDEDTFLQIANSFTFTD